MHRIRIVIVDDHALVRGAFRAMLEAQPDMTVLGEAADGVEAVKVCLRLLPDVVLMDLSMPGRGGIAATREIRSLCLGTRIIAVTMHEDDTYARQAYLAGASGYVLKKAHAEELISAIRKVYQGQEHFRPSLLQALKENRPAVPICEDGSPLSLLSAREREVASLVALGYTSQEIGQKLHITDRTVDTHRTRIMEKLGLRKRADIVRFALDYNLMGA